MWALYRKIFKQETGAVTLEYLILALLITGVVAAIVAGVQGPLTSVHNAAVQNTIDITGSGY